MTSFEKESMDYCNTGITDKITDGHYLDDNLLPVMRQNRKSKRESICQARPKSTPTKCLVRRSVQEKSCLAASKTNSQIKLKKGILKKYASVIYPNRTSNKLSSMNGISYELDHGNSFSAVGNEIISKNVKVSPQSDAGYVDDVIVDSEHDDVSRRSNGYHSMEEFQLTSVSPPSQSESPLSNAGEGVNSQFLCSKASSGNYNTIHFTDHHPKPDKRKLNLSSYDVDSDFAESPHSFHLPNSSCSFDTPKSPDILKPVYKVDSSIDSERPLVLKIKCDRSPHLKKSPVYFCESVNSNESPPKLRLFDANKRNSSDNARTSSGSAKCVTDSAKCVTDTNNQNSHDPLHGLHECISSDGYSQSAHNSNSRKKISRRNSSRICSCLSSPKKRRHKNLKRSHSSGGKTYFITGSTLKLTCEVGHMTNEHKRFVKSALHLSVLQQKLHKLFCNLFPLLKDALETIPPESIRFEDLFNEVITILQQSSDEDDRTNTEELSTRLHDVSLDKEFKYSTLQCSVNLCTTPRDCLTSFQEKVYTLLKLLLPNLTLTFKNILRLPKDLEQFLDKLIFNNYNL